jgi:REP-associated tyrosine transposase
MGIALCSAYRMMSNRPRRLRNTSYIGYQRYFLTTCTAHKQRAFATDGVAQACLLQLRQSAGRHGFALVAYCFMPDHVHLLVYGTSAQADLQAFMKHFKKVTGFEYSQRFKRRLWQPGYHDRIMRNDESTEATARYILENPVRAGLAQQLGEYPYAGSDLYDTQAFVTAWDKQV